MVPLLSTSTPDNIISRAFPHGSTRWSEPTCTAITDIPIAPPPPILDRLQASIRVAGDHRIELRRGWIDAREFVMLNEFTPSTKHHGHRLLIARDALGDLSHQLATLHRALRTSSAPGRGQGRLF